MNDPDAMVEEDNEQSSCRLRMQDIEKRFGATLALKGVNLEVRSGEVMALVGENGAGKSTLMKVLSGAHVADKGKMWIEGMPYAPKSPIDARNAGIGMIYQELSLAPHLTVTENIMLGNEICAGPWVNWRGMRQHSMRALQEVGLDPNLADWKVSRLSIGLQQMIEIARAIAMNCRVLVLDEPTSSLTQSDIKKLFDLVRRLRLRGISIVYISHFLEEVNEISNRITVLRDGQSVGSANTDEFDVDDIVTAMVGRNVDELYPRSERNVEDNIALEFSALSGVAGPKQASLKLRRGSVTGICGLVGSGRTELFQAIFGLQPVKHGQIKIGVYSGPASPNKRWQQRVGLVSEDRKSEGLALNQSIADNITLPALNGLGPWRFVLPKKQNAAAESLIKRLSIKCRGPQQTVDKLSGGNQQKVAIARLLFADVDVLLLDEPTRGIDVGAKAQIYQLINDLATKHGKSVLLISSYLPELLGICDEIAVMCRGVLSQALPVEEWDEEKLMMVATGQESSFGSTSAVESGETNG